LLDIGVHVQEAFARIIDVTVDEIDAGLQ